MNPIIAFPLSDYRALSTGDVRDLNVKRRRV